MRGLAQAQAEYDAALQALRDCLRLTRGTSQSNASLRQGLNTLAAAALDPFPSASISVCDVTSIDPNDKTGPQGTGGGHFVVSSEPVPYLIRFENKPTATAPAEIVEITDQLDLVRLDVSTLTLGPITFTDKLVTPPSVPLSALGTYTTTVDLWPAKNMLVVITAELNTTTGVLRWRFESLDARTGKPPTGVDGFLPPGGNGSVLFTVRFKNALPTNTQVRNKATIFFNGVLLPTPEWVNTIDVTAPISRVAALPTTQPTSFVVRWSGTDVGAGVEMYDVYRSRNNGPFTAWLTNTAATQAQLTGAVGDTYCFYSIARDLVGNLETSKSTADACTRIAVVNQDGVVNCADVAIVRAAFGKRTGQPGWDGRADVVVDGVIDVRDLAFVSQKLPVGTQCQ